MDTAHDSREPVAGSGHDHPDHPDHHGFSRWRLVVAGFVLLLFVVVLVLTLTVIPREWAQWAGGRIDGHLLRGTGLGLTLGLIFTALPLLVLRQTIRPIGWTLRWVLVVVAAITAIPNLLTLGIVVGSGHAAHAGERILDVDGPGFRFGSLLGALVAAGLLLAFWCWRIVVGRRNRSARSAS